MYKFLNERGRIPAHTVCPFKKGCATAAAGNCYHLGEESTVDFSCALARMFDMFTRNEEQEKKEQNERATHLD
jgi:hypothetical protein